MKALIRKAILLSYLCAIKVAIVGNVTGLTVKLPDLIPILDACVFVDTPWGDVHELSVYES